MAPKRLPKRARGQSLVEYALIIVLVGIVAIVALFLVGLAAERIFGITVAALGTKVDNVRGHIVIDTAQCVKWISANTLGLQVWGTTDEDPANLTASTERVVGTSLTGELMPITLNGTTPNTFMLNREFADTADWSLCPQAIVIQAKDGVMAGSQLTHVEIP